ncbi:MAG: peptidoglycan DD-metalloendopeptidase family protein [Actinobacteria bacterium]|nr:peptidoglycan DD-metalloendopeptidase family protein [Actinomycetota bacterium]
MHAPTRSLIAAVVVAALVGGALPLGAQQAEQSRLKQAQAKLEQVEAALAEAGGARDAARMQLAEADEQLRTLEDAVNLAAIAVEQQVAVVAGAQARLDRAQADADAVGDLIAVRVSEMYKRGSVDVIELLATASSPSDALDRASFVSALVGNDRARLEQLDSLQIAVTAERERLEAELGRLSTIEAEQRQLAARAQELRDHRALQAAAAEEEVRELAQHKEVLAEESAELERVIREKQRRAAEAAAAAARAAAARAAAAQAPAPPTSVSGGGYIWPLCGAVTSGYGRRWGRMHAGLDIDGDTGDPIVASRPGLVILAGWQNGYGQLVVVDHGDGVSTAYAHQSRIRVSEGQAVDRGQRLGDVGSTGRSTGPHLHFEVRVNGSPIDPRRVLPASC